MSDLYLCEALEKRGEFLRLQAHFIHPEYPVFYYSKTFVLNLLFDYWDAAQTDVILASPLYQRIPRYAPEPCNYFHEFQDEIISQVTVVEEANYPAESPLDIRNYREQLGELPRCVYDVVLTDAKWAAHIPEKKTWTSAAGACETTLY